MHCHVGHLHGTKGKAHDEIRPAIRPGVESLNGAHVALHNRSANRQPESQAAELARDLPTPLLKRGENLLGSLRLKSNAIINNLSTELTGDGIVSRDLNAATGRGEFDGIADQVPENLL